MSDPETIIAESKAAYEELLGEFKSVILGTSDPEGTPEASYNPAVMDDDRNIYIYVSDLSAHTANILSRKEASVLIVPKKSSAFPIAGMPSRLCFSINSGKCSNISWAWAIST